MYACMYLTEKRAKRRENVVIDDEDVYKESIYAAGGCSYFSHVFFFFCFLQVLFHYHFPGVALFLVKCGVVVINVLLLILTKALMMMFMVMFIDLN